MIIMLHLLNSIFCYLGLVNRGCVIKPISVSLELRRWSIKYVENYFLWEIMFQGTFNCFLMQHLHYMEIQEFIRDLCNCVIEVCKWDVHNFGWSSWSYIMNSIEYMILLYYTIEKREEKHIFFFFSMADMFFFLIAKLS